MCVIFIRSKYMLVGIVVVLVSVFAGASLAFGFFSNEYSVINSSNANVTDVTNSSFNDSDLINDSEKNISYGANKKRNKSNNGGYVENHLGPGHNCLGGDYRIINKSISSAKTKKLFEKSAVLEENEFAGESKFVNHFGWMFPIYDKETKEFVRSICVDQYGDRVFQWNITYEEFKKLK